MNCIWGSPHTGPRISLMSNDRSAADCSVVYARGDTPCLNLLPRWTMRPARKLFFLVGIKLLGMGHASPSERVDDWMT